MKSYPKSSISWSNGFDLEGKRKELCSLQADFQRANFWDNPDEASKKQKMASQLKEEIDSFRDFEKELAELKDFAAIYEADNEVEEQLKQKLEALRARIEEKELAVFLSGEYDKKDAIISIQSGAGGRDAEDWVCLLLKMYQRYVEKMGWEYKIISQSFTEGGGPEGRIGIKEVEMGIKGKFAFGYLKKESGAHRLVRLSPFSSKQLRHTSFAKVEVIPKIESDEINENILKADDLKIETFRASGAGGQNVNRRETAIRVTHLPTGLVAICQNERYQAVNKKIALEILAGKVLQLKEKEKQADLAKIRGERIEADFGHQVRSYVLHPYNLVKDHRSLVETTNTQAVLNGEIDEFIIAEIKV